MSPSHCPCWTSCFQPLRQDVVRPCQWSQENENHASQHHCNAGRQDDHSACCCDCHHHTLEWKHRQYIEWIFNHCPCCLFVVRLWWSIFTWSWIASTQLNADTKRCCCKLNQPDTLLLGDVWLMRRSLRISLSSFSSSTLAMKRPINLPRNFRLERSVSPKQGNNRLLPRNGYLKLKEYTSYV